MGTMSSYNSYQSAYTNLTAYSSSGLGQQTNQARPAPSQPSYLPPKARLDGDSDFTITLEQNNSRGRVRYEIYLAGDKPDYDNRVDYGYGKSPKQAEKKARERIDEILRPYKPKPTLDNFIPSIVKRVM